MSPSRPHAPQADDRRSPNALDLRRFTPAVITFLAQRIVATASAEYRPQFGVGVTDWRILAQLAAEPWLAPVRIAESTGLDKAAVSRSLRDLRDAGFVEADDGGRRRSVFALTPSGVALHDRLAEAARLREQRLLDGFSDEEREKLADMLERMLRQVSG